MPDAFELHDEPLGEGRHLLAVHGEIDLFTAPELRQRLVALIDGGVSGLLIDLRETSFLDSTGLGVLIGAVKRIGDGQGRLVIVNTDASIAKTFEVTGLNQVFTVCPDRAQGEKMLTAPEGAAA